MNEAQNIPAKYMKQIYQKQSIMLVKPLFLCFKSL
jgi:hypothetical protein